MNGDLAEDGAVAATFPPESLSILLDILWFEILDHFVDDAITLARIAMVSKGCQRRVFGSLRHLLRKAAPFSTAAPMSKSYLAPGDPRRRNDFVLPKPLFELWWANKLDDDYDEATDDDRDYSPPDDGGNNGNPSKRRKICSGGDHSEVNHEDDAIVPTQYDRLEGLGYYQAVVRAGLLQKRRVITNDNYSRNRVPHSALRMERMLEILETGSFCRNKSLFENMLTSDQEQPQQPAIQHDCVNPPNYGGGGMAYCMAHFMVWEEIIPNFLKVDFEEHVNIILYPARKKYRECGLYQTYMSTVPANWHQMGWEARNVIFNRMPIPLLLLIASESRTFRW